MNKNIAMVEVSAGGADDKHKAHAPSEGMGLGGIIKGCCLALLQRCACVSALRPSR